MPGRASTKDVVGAAELLTELKARLDYDAKTGALYRKAGFRGVEAGFRLGTLDSGGKRQTTFLGRRYQVDHLVWLLETGALPRVSLTHINSDNGDDRFENLREGRRASVKGPSKAAAEAFMSKARAAYPRIDFSATVYLGKNHPLTAFCPIHGAFTVKPRSLMQTALGCGRCGQEARAALVRKAPEAKKATKLTYMRANAGMYREANKRSRALLESDPARKQRRDAADRARSRAWSKTEKGRVHGRLQRHRRRTRLKGLPSTGVTASEWQAICDAHRNDRGDVCCAYCKRACRPTMDHVVPIARGGLDEPSNVLPACGSCNSSKCDKLINEWPKAAALLPPDELQSLVAYTELYACA